MEDMILREMKYKIQVVIDYLKENNGYDYKLYNHSDELDSDIVEYAEDVKYLINNYFNQKNINETDVDTLPF